MSPAKTLVRRVIFYQGIITIANGLTWIIDTTQGRLLGIGWLELLLGFIPVLTTDGIIGIVWCISGSIMVAAGTRLSRKRRKLENAGFLVGFLTPILVGLIFLASFIMGDHPTGYMYILSYMMWIAPYLAYLRLKPEEVSEHTQQITVVTKVEQ